MSDVSKTNELIAEARLAACSECSEEGTSPPMRCDGDLIRRLADALEAATRVPVQGEPRDVRELLHAKCDCVSDLGPAHCHLCGNEQGSPVPWPECSAVRTAAPEPEDVWEYQCTNNISTTGLVDDPELHAMQCSGKIERRRKAGPWLPVEGEKP